MFQAASLWALVLGGGLMALLASLALVSDNNKKGRRMAWEEGLGYGNKNNLLAGVSDKVEPRRPTCV